MEQGQPPKWQIFVYDIFKYISAFGNLGLDTSQLDLTLHYQTALPLSRAVVQYEQIINLLF